MAVVCTCMAQVNAAAASSATAEIRKFGRGLRLSVWLGRRLELRLGASAESSSR